MVKNIFSKDKESEYFIKVQYSDELSSLIPQISDETIQILDEEAKEFVKQLMTTLNETGYRIEIEKYLTALSKRVYRESFLSTSTSELLKQNAEIGDATHDELTVALGELANVVDMLKGLNENNVSFLDKMIGSLGVKSLTERVQEKQITKFNNVKSKSGGTIENLRKNMMLLQDKMVADNTAYKNILDDLISSLNERNLFIVFLNRVRYYALKMIEDVKESGVNNQGWFDTINNLFIADVDRYIYSFINSQSFAHLQYKKMEYSIETNKDYIRECESILGSTIADLELSLTSSKVVIDQRIYTNIFTDIKNTANSLNKNSMALLEQNKSDYLRLGNLTLNQDEYFNNLNTLKSLASNHNSNVQRIAQANREKIKIIDKLALENKENEQNNMLKLN